MINPPLPFLYLLLLLLPPPTTPTPSSTRYSNLPSSLFSPTSQIPSLQKSLQWQNSPTNPSVLSCAIRTPSSVVLISLHRSPTPNPSNLTLSPVLICPPYSNPTIMSLSTPRIHAVAESLSKGIEGMTKMIRESEIIGERENIEVRGVMVVGGVEEGGGETERGVSPDGFTFWDDYTKFPSSNGISVYVIDGCEIYASNKRVTWYGYKLGCGAHEDGRGWGVEEGEQFKGGEVEDAVRWGVNEALRRGGKGRVEVYVKYRDGRVEIMEHDEIVKHLKK